MKYFGNIKKINHIVVSDPSYKKDVWCRYEIDNLKEEDWIVNLDINHIDIDIKDCTVGGETFTLLIKKDNDVCHLTNEALSCYQGINVKKYRIGMDTACIALGINDKAKEIIDSVDEWQPNCSMRTGTDGIFGEVYEGKDNDGNLCFLYIEGYFSDDMGYDEDYIKEYLIDQFEINDLQKDNSEENEI